MKRLLQILAVVVVLLFLIPVAAAVAFYFFFDPNDYRDEIAGYVEEQTGREMAIDGEIGLTFFPWLGITVGGVTLANAEGFEAAHFAEVEVAAVRIRFLPLLRRELHLDTVRLDGLRLNLARDADGRSNWDDILERLETAPAEPIDPEPEADTPLEPEDLHWELAGLDLRDAQIVWEDATVPARYTVSGANLRAGAVTMGEPANLRLDFHLEADEPALAGPVRLTGDLTLAPDLTTVTVTGLELDTALEGEGLPGGRLESQGSIQRVHWQEEGDRLEVRELALQVFDVDVTAQLEGSELTGDPRFEGRIAVVPFNARELMQMLEIDPPETADPEALTRIALNSDFAAGVTALSLESFELTLDETRLEGTMGAADLDATPRYEFDLTADELDLDRYLPPPAEDEEPSPEPGETPGEPAGPPDLAPLRELHLDGRLAIGQVKVANLTARDVSLEANAEDGTIRLHPLTASLYEGEYTGDVGLDVREDEAQLSIDQTLSDIEIGPLMADLMDADWITGRGDVELQATARGLEPDRLTRTLNGNAAVQLSDGAVRGLNIPHLVRDAQAILAREDRPDRAEARDTDFAELTATADITDGVVHNDDLDMRSPLLRASGAGEADLPASELDYLLRVRLVETLEGQAAEDEDLSGIEIPIAIRGPFDDLRIRPEIDDALRERAREELREEEERVRERLEEGREELEERLEEELQGPLRDLLR